MMNIHCYCLIRPDFSPLGEMSWLSSWSRRGETQTRPDIWWCGLWRAQGRRPAQDQHLVAAALSSVSPLAQRTSPITFSHLLDKANKVQHWRVSNWGCQHFFRGLFTTRESFMTKVTRFEFPINVKFHFPNKFIKAQGFNLSNLSYLPEWSDQW